MFNTKQSNIDKEEKAVSSPVRSGDHRRFQAIEEHLFSDLNGEAVVLSLRNGKYYGLNEVGKSVWNAVQQSSTLEEIESSVIAEFDVDPETCCREVHDFVDRLMAEGLIEMTTDG